MSKKVIKLEKEDFTPENIRKAYLEVLRRKVRRAVLETIYEKVWGNNNEQKGEIRNESNDVNEAHS